MRARPTYPIVSVDHALALMEMVRDYGQVRLSDAAELLGVSVSTAHRLMAMLVYRGYAERDAARGYVPGPALGLTPAGQPRTAELRRRCQPHLESLTSRVDETSNLVIRTGTEVRCLTSVEGSRPIHVGDRQGVVLPAAASAGGKVLLAQMDADRVGETYRYRAEAAGTSFDAGAHASLAAELAVVRTRGFAINVEAAEEDVSAVGVAVRDGSGTVAAALCVSVPRSRFRTLIEAGLIAHLMRVRAELESDLRDFEIHAW